MQASRATQVDTRTHAAHGMAFAPLCPVGLFYRLVFFTVRVRGWGDRLRGRNGSGWRSSNHLVVAILVVFVIVVVSMAVTLLVLLLAGFLGSWKGNVEGKFTSVFDTAQHIIHLGHDRANVESYLGSIHPGCHEIDLARRHVNMLNGSRKFCIVANQ